MGKFLSRQILCLSIVISAINVIIFTAANAVLADYEPQKYALLIGINKYSGSNFMPLQGSINDIHLMRDILASPRFGFQAENITEITDEHATHMGIKAEFEALEAKLKPGDIAYIHYSGHGSTTCDLTGKDPTGIDQTLVGFGSRSDPGPPDMGKIDCRSLRPDSPVILKSSGENLDNYDILDKELNVWLSRLAQKTDQVIFVSDSCHSGTITRSPKAMATRGVPADTRLHPLASVDFPTTITTGKPSWLAIGAARDEELASECQVSDRSHGAFTWFWAKAMQEAGPKDTWQDIYRRTVALLAQIGLGRRQHPQLEGDGDRLLFGGKVKERPKTFSVLSVAPDNQTATVDAGDILGVGPGSVFRKFDPNVSDQSTLPTLIVTKATDLDCQVRFSGTIKGGDAVILETWHPSFAPLKVFVQADLEADKPQLDELRAMLDALPAFIRAESQEQCDLILWLLRPKQEAGGKDAYVHPNDSLPVSYPESPLQVWVLDPGEHLYDGREALKVLFDQKGLQTLKNNLASLARARGMLTLAPPPGQENPLEVTLRLYAPVAKFTGEMAGDADIVQTGSANDARYWRLEKCIPMSDLKEQRTDTQQHLLEVQVNNRSDKNFYVYGLNITKNGKILPFLPSRRYPRDCLVAAGQSSVFIKYRLLLTEPLEYVRILASQSPLDVFIVTQEGYKRYDEKRGASLHPLEFILASRSGVVRSDDSSGLLQVTEWTTLQMSFVKR